MISVIVCTYNRCERLRSALGSLAQLRAPSDISWELIVVDNNCTDETAEAIKTFAANSRICVRYVFEAQQGLSYARNAGIKAARGDIVAFTDDDVTVHPRWLCELQKTFDEYDCLGVGGKIVPVWNGQEPSWLRRDGPFAFRSGVIVSFDQGEEAQELTISPVGANMAYKKVGFEEHGFFRTDLGKIGKDSMLGEEVEFCMRLFRAGRRVVYAPKAIVYHPVELSKLKKSFESHYFNWGRYLARVDGFPKDSVRYFGVPRYLFRSTFSHVCMWAFALDSHERFHHKLQVYEFLGEISEAHRLSTEAK
jgi:glycosyltransferase involved in cell wall biosynthesis